ncbi:MAG: hypothetical protein ACM3U2_21740 [Deltaproteobacteria bacterium]
MPHNPGDDQSGPGGRDDGAFPDGVPAHTGSGYGNGNTGHDDDNPRDNESKH